MSQAGILSYVAPTVGDVDGPASSTDNAIVRWDGTTGKLIKDSYAILQQGIGTTIGAVSTNLISINMGTAKAFAFEVLIAGFNSTTPASAGYSISGVARTTGAAITVTIGDSTAAEEAALVGATAVVTSSGNNLLVQVTGVALLTINWKATITYIGVS